MEAVLSTRAAVLQALREGPRYGRDLIRVLEGRAPGIVNPRPGTVYRAAAALVRERLLQTWTVVPGGERGARSRRYFELTPRGIAAADRQRRAVARLFGDTSGPPAIEEEAAMRNRLRRASDVSTFARKLQHGVLGNRRTR
jgi:DNA-binding PadR family transcriptional regulator